MCDCCLEHMQQSQRYFFVDKVATENVFAVLEQKLSALPGIMMAEYLPHIGQAKVTYDSRATNLELVEKNIISISCEIIK